MPERVETISERVALVRGRHGTFLVNRHDIYVGQAMMAYGEFSELESRMLVGLVATGSTVIEAGAHCGTHTVAMAKRAAPGGVIAIEPQSEMFNLLCANIAMNAPDHARAIMAAAGAAAGVTSLPPMDYAAAGNFGGVELGQGPGQRVPVIALDDLEINAPVSLVKIDVEGMEREVIAGAQKLIALHRPILYVENDRPEKSPPLITAIKALDYALWWHLPPLFNPDNAFGNADNRYPKTVSCNMICMPAERGLAMEGLIPIKNPAVHPFPGNA